MALKAPKSTPLQSAAMVCFADAAVDRSLHALHVLTLCRLEWSHPCSHSTSLVSLGLYCVRPPAVGYANSVANDKFVRTEADPGFPLTGGLKDVGHMQQLGKDSGAAMPVVDIIMQHMRQVCSTHIGSYLLRFACTAIALHLGTACTQYVDVAIPVHVCMLQPLPSCSITCA